MKELEWSQDFPHYNTIEATKVYAMETKVLIQSVPKPTAVNPPPQ